MDELRRDLGVQEVSVLVERALIAQIIADSSIRVDHFNKGDVELAGSLRRREIVMHAMIVGETALGSSADRRGTLLDWARCHLPPRWRHTMTSCV